MLLTWMCQLRAAIKWSRSMKDASKKQENMLFRLRAIDLRDRTTINVHVRPPTVACVALSNAARVDSFLPYFRLKSPSIEQAPIAHVRSARDHITYGFSFLYEIAGTVAHVIKSLFVMQYRVSRLISESDDYKPSGHYWRSAILIMRHARGSADPRRAKPRRSASLILNRTVIAFNFVLNFVFNFGQIWITFL